jgi:5-methyltetrahydrofolate--homocysteine methyltransferase
MDWKGSLSGAVRHGKDEETLNLVKEALGSGIQPVDILEQGLVPGIQALGELFKDGQVFLPEVLISVRAMNRGLEELKPHLAEADVPIKGKVVLGTVEGDMHDIGKNLVGMMLSSNGYEVVDLGVDVDTDLFISTAKDENADIIGLSGLLTTTIPYFKTVIDSLEEAGLRTKVKVLIGGAPVTKTYAEEIRAEGFAEDCVTAVDEADRLMQLK